MFSLGKKGEMYIYEHFEIYETEKNPETGIS